MKKGINTSIVLALVIAIFTAYTGIGCAFTDKKHDEYMEKVLFGEDYYITSDRIELDQKSTELKYASYLAIDQTGNPDCKNGDNEKLRFLKNQGVSNLPKSVSEISLPSIFYGDHDMYTHMGWNHNYNNDNLDEEYNQGTWKIRKRILLNTTNEVFDFGITKEIPGKFGISYCEQCDAFAELVYYVHVLGDDISDFEKENTKYSNYEIPTDTVPFAGAKTKNKDKINIAIEITRLMPKLFKNHSSNFNSRRHYRELMHELKTIDKKCQTIVYSEKGVNSRTNYAMYEQYCEETMDLLIEHVPPLLMNEKFFSKVFKQ